MTERGVTYFNRPLPRLAAPGDRQADREYERRLLLRYHRDGDLVARERLLERLLPLAHSLARRYATSGEPLEDLEQVAGLGLLKALDRYDPDRGSSFISFAAPTILGELKRHFRDKAWAIHVPRATQELALKVNEAVGVLSTRLGRSPSAKEIASHLDEPTEAVLEAMEAATAYDALSLDSRPFGDDHEERRSYADTVASEDPGYELVELRQTLSGTVRALPNRERTILHLRFVHDLTQSEIAERVGLSQMHVSRLLRRSLQRLSASAQAE